MHIQKIGVKFAVLDRKENELCRFDRLADACIVQRYLNGQKLTEKQEQDAMLLIIGGGQVDSRREEKRVPAELAKAEQG